MVHVKDHVTSNTHVKYESYICYGSIVIAKVKVFLKSRSRSKGKKLWYHVKDHVTSNTHVKDESYIFYGS